MATTMMFWTRVLVVAAFCVFATKAGKFKVRLDQQRGFFEGDVPLNSRNRNGILKSARWTNGVIYYDYGIGVTQEYKDLVEGALKEIQQNTCIRFYPRSNEKNFIRIINSTGCWSPVGMVGGMQQLSLMDTEYSGSCWYHEVILHEFLHAVGLWHEQSRYDRDNYITIDTRSVSQGMRFNFDIVTNQQSSVYGQPYDYYSVMHYSKTAFSSNNQITIYPRDNYYLDVIGNQKRGSKYDWAKVNAIYDCKGTGGGGVSNNECVDRDQGCADWAKDGHCSGNPSYMSANCYKSCNPSQCGGGSGGGSSAKCVDKDSGCPVWAKDGHCSINPGYMLSNCYKSCYPSECGSGGACSDSDNGCPAWAANGDCSRNSGYMLNNCKKSCNVC